MRNINYNGKKAICSICVIMALWIVGAHAATLPPDPDNAALLYYQAFLLRPEMDYDTWWSIDEVLRGADPNEKVREYLNLPDCHKTIEFTEAASQLPQCNWGIRFSQGIGAPLPQLVHFRDLSFLIYADARVLAADGNYKEAFSRCLMIHRIAKHVGDDTLLFYLISLSLDGLAHRCTQDILGSMPPDIDTLTWLRGRFAAEQDVAPSLARALEMDLELILQAIRTDTNDLVWLRGQLVENTDDENTKEEILGLTNEELIAFVREPNVDFLNSILHVIDSELTYEEKYMEIQRLTEVMDDENAVSNYVGAGRTAEHYNIKVRNTAHFNALKDAIEIYLIKAKTGQLPDILPPGLPKDPFSDQDFEYEITEKGFVLRCRAKDIHASQAFRPPGTDPDVVHEYEFELQM